LWRSAQCLLLAWPTFGTYALAASTQIIRLQCLRQPLFERHFKVSLFRARVFTPYIEKSRRQRNGDGSCHVRFGGKRNKARCTRYTQKLGCRLVCNAWGWKDQEVAGGCWRAVCMYRAQFCLREEERRAHELMKSARQYRDNNTTSGMRSQLMQLMRSRKRR
jgi:hypothetical protein